MQHAYCGAAFLWGADSWCGVLMTDSIADSDLWHEFQEHLKA
jgi:hypothetical protein